MFKIHLPSKKKKNHSDIPLFVKRCLNCFIKKHVIQYNTGASWMNKRGRRGEKAYLGGPQSQPRNALGGC